MWQAYHMGGEMAALGIMVALLNHRTERPDAASTCRPRCTTRCRKNTEVDLPNWIYNRLDHHRQTCRHAGTEAA
jgi:hypothetical protein